MDLETAVSLFKQLENDKTVQSYYAKANARYILYGVKEDESNFPNYQLNLDDGGDNLAFSYLSIGCCLFEEEYSENDENGRRLARVALERGGEYIEYNHLYEQSRRNLSPYYLLIGALAYYGASQYSKAFIVIKQVNEYSQTDVSQLTSAFLRKDFGRVFELLSKILLDEEGYVNQFRDFETVDDRIQVVLYARAFAKLMDFIYHGIESSLQASKGILDDLSELLMLEREPSFWWIVRLVKLIINGFEENSLWNAIPPYFPEGYSKIFIDNLVFSERPIIELFVVQKKALKTVLSEKGGVVSLPTSSGKTRIAEVAIFKSLTQHIDSKVLFIAPFRSLAYEIEKSLSSTFEKMGYVVSQLYGNGQFNQMDNKIIQHSDILIVTPEKAKVILRANNQITRDIKLVVIDEGHLLNAQERQVRNEMFVEELKKYVVDNQGKIVLLSAVLPNSEEIAEWITDDSNAVIFDEERVSRQRLGVLNFRKSHVHLRWYGEEESYNPNFIRAFKPSPKHTKFRPSNKAEAVAYTAIKLSKDQSLLIFIANARSVLSYGGKIIEAMKHKDELILHRWEKQSVWEKLQLLCNEYSNDTNTKLLEFAKYGVLCHTGKINPEIRSVIEVLMREDKPRIIIATTTLGQGVNLGVSSIIFAGTKYYNEKNKGWNRINNNDFWNIVGRAGRAFIDTEGKILFATESKKEVEEALDYFDGEPDNAVSGLLEQIVSLKMIAKKCNVDFDHLLDLVTLNNFEDFSQWYDKKTKEGVKEKIQDFFDWIDDTLLSFELLLGEEESIDDYLRRTLAFIQARNSPDLDEEDVVYFLKARCKAIREIVTKDLNCNRLISSGLPLSSAIMLDVYFDEILEFTKIYQESSQLVEDKIIILKKIENIMVQMPSRVFKYTDGDGNPKYTEELLDKFREIWLKGEDIYSIEENRKVNEICTKYYGYTLSWFLGAISNRLKKEKEEEDLFAVDYYSELIEELTLCCELGVPDLPTAKIYMAGIKSRKASKEIRETFEFFTYTDGSESIWELKKHLLNKIDVYKSLDLSEVTLKWLELLEKTSQRNKQKIEAKYFPKELDEKNIQRCYVRNYNDNYYICNTDYSNCIRVQIDEDIKGFMEKISNTNNMFFSFEEGKWQLVNKLR